MLSDIAAGQISAVYVYKLDRISRNLADFTQLLRTFRTHRVEFVSHTERFETASPMGQAMQSLLMVFAQLERETICGRVRDAAFARAKIGFDTGGAPPIGFRKIPAQLMGKATQILSPDADAPTIAAGFRTCAAGHSLRELALQWNAADFTTARGNPWTVAAVGRILHNPVYVQADGRIYEHLASLGAVLCIPEPPPIGNGIYLYADRRRNHTKFTDLHDTFAIAAPHRGIVPAEVWLACQQNLSVHRQARTLGTSPRSPFLGMLFCRKCGSAVTAVQGRSAMYLVCGGKKRGKCSGIGTVWRLSVLEQLLMEAFTWRLSCIARYASAPAADTQAIQEALDAARLRKVQLERSLLELNDAEIKPVAAAIAALSARCESLEAELHSQRKPASTDAFPPFSTLSPTVQKQVAAMLARCVILSEDTAAVYFT